MCPGYVWMCPLDIGRIHFWGLQRHILDRHLWHSTPVHTSKGELHQHIYYLYLASHQDRISNRLFSWKKRTLCVMKPLLTRNPRGIVSEESGTLSREGSAHQKCTVNLKKNACVRSSSQVDYHHLEELQIREKHN